MARPKRQKRPTRRIAIHLHERAGKADLSREFKRLRVPHFINQAIAQSARRPTSKHPRQSGVFVCGTMQGVPVDCWDNRFRTSEKRGTDLYAARPKGERGSDTPAIGDATGSDHRYANGVHHLRDQSHRADQPCAIALLLTQARITAACNALHPIEARFCLTALVLLYGGFALDGLVTAHRANRL